MISLWIGLFSFPAILAGCLIGWSSRYHHPFMLWWGALCFGYAILVVLKGPDKE